MVEGINWCNKSSCSLTIIMLFINLNSGIANTMDLPEKLLPRISSRLGIQRLCFGPYNYQQLQEIISSRLQGIDAFERQAIEFASRKVSLCAISSWDLINYGSQLFHILKGMLLDMHSHVPVVQVFMNIIFTLLFTYSGGRYFWRCTPCSGDM